MSILDPRTLTDGKTGTPLRDAAVDPLPEDYLAPTNAGAEGEAGNPHGPNVVNPEVHGSQGRRPILPGPVPADPDAQDTAETAHAVRWNTDADGDGANDPVTDDAPTA